MSKYVRELVLDSIGEYNEILWNEFIVIHEIVIVYCILTKSMHYASSLVNYCNISHEFGKSVKPDQIMLKEMSYLQSFDVSSYK